ncbi:MAG: hypothetical protein H7834_09890 [Magnetococcus sp. YQC-9]
MTLARSLKEAFFAFFLEKCAARRQGFGIVLRLLQNNPANMASDRLFEARTISGKPRSFFLPIKRNFQAVKSAWLIHQAQPFEFAP